MPRNALRRTRIATSEVRYMGWCEGMRVLTALALFVLCRRLWTLFDIVDEPVRPVDGHSITAGLNRLDHMLASPYPGTSGFYATAVGNINQLFTVVESGKRYHVMP